MGVTFIPMVAETLGGLGEDSINTIRACHQPESKFSVLSVHQFQTALPPIGDISLERQRVSVVCHPPADEFGDHQVGCGGNGDRHNAVRDVLFIAAQSAALGPTREASNVVPD